MKKQEVKKTAKKNAKNSPPKPGLTETYILPFALFFFAFLLYANTINHDYALDDDIVTRKNVYVEQGFSGIPMIFSKGFLYGFNQRNDQSYRPVSLLTLAVETGWFGSKPGPHHVFNILYYALACVVLYHLLRKLFPDYSAWLPFCIALLFASHPIHTEAVANIKSRDEILNLLLLMSTLLKLMQFVDSGRKSHLITAVILYFLALLTKEQAITFLAIIPMTLFFFRKISFKRIMITSLPFFLAAGIYMVLRLLILDNVTFGETMTLENNTLAAAAGLQQRLATAMLIMGRYLLLLVFPHPLSWDYSFNQIPLVTFSNPGAIVSVILYLALFIYSLVRFKAKDIFSYSFLFFIITMSVVSNIFILIGSTLGERFLLTPSVVYCISLFFIIQKITRTDFTKQVVKASPLFYSIIIPILILYSVKTVARNPDWKNNLALFSAGVDASPNSARAHSSLAFTCKMAGMQLPDAESRLKYFNMARAHFNKSLEILPDNTYALYNLGVMEFEQGNRDAAKAIYIRALKVNPKDLNVLNNLSYICIQKEEYDEALKYLLRTLALTPRDGALIGNIGAIYQRKHNYAEAMKYDEMALSTDPGSEVVISNLITVCYNLGLKEKAEYYLSLKNHLPQNLNK